MLYTQIVPNELQEYSVYSTMQDKTQKWPYGSKELQCCAPMLLTALIMLL